MRSILGGRGELEGCEWERMSSSERYFEDVIDLTETFLGLDRQRGGV